MRNLCEKSLASGPRSGLVAGFVLILSLQSSVQAKDETNEETSTSVEAPASALPAAASKKPSATDLDGEFSSDVKRVSETMSWDSYLDFNDSDGIADQVTAGIRVEDIVEPPSQYRYAAFGKPDPFVPPMLTISRTSAAEIPITSVLQRYDLDTLKIVGMWELANGERKALIMTPKDEGIVVRLGDAIGTRGGKILQIEPKSIKVREFILSPDGTRQFEDTDVYIGQERPDENTTLLNQAVGAASIDQPASKSDATPSGLLDREADVLRRQELTTTSPPPPPKEEPESVIAPSGRPPLQMFKQGSPEGAGVPNAPTGQQGQTPSPGMSGLPQGTPINTQPDAGQVPQAGGGTATGGGAASGQTPAIPSGSSVPNTGVRQ